MMAVIGSMAAILVHERKRIREIEAGTETIRQVRRDISEAHRCITRLALLGEGVVGWDETDYRHYHAQLLSTDSLLQAMKPLCREYVRPAQIDTLRSLLTDKETHLRHIMEVMERQDEANSLLVNHLPEVARRATRVRTVRKKKSGLAGFFGGKKTVQVLPSAGELHAFSDSLTALQRKQAAEMEAYADSLRIRNRTLNRELGRLIRDLDTQAQAAFDAREQDISEAQALSVRLLTATISAAIVLLFLSGLAIHREIRRNDHERKQREQLIRKLQESNNANEKLIKLRRNLIQNVTHELRTPLTAIGGNAELLLDDTEADSRIRHAQTIHDAAGRMAGMINSLLVYFRLDRGKETPVIKPFKLCSIAGTLETEFGPLAASKHPEYREQPAIQRHQIYQKRKCHIDNRIYQRHIYLVSVRHRHGHDKGTATADIRPVRAAGQLRDGGRLRIRACHRQRHGETAEWKHHSEKQTGQRKPLHRKPATAQSGGNNGHRKDNC